MYLYNFGDLIWVESMIKVKFIVKCHSFKIKLRNNVLNAFETTYILLNLKEIDVTYAMIFTFEIFFHAQIYL